MSEKSPNKRAQSSAEFLSVYGMALLITAILVGLLVTILSIPQLIAPPSCSIQNKAFCNDLVVGVNSVTKNAIIAIAVVNTQPYPIKDPSIMFTTNGRNTTSSSCSPNLIPAGGIVICTANLPAQITYASGALISGRITLLGKACPLQVSGSQCGNNAANFTSTGNFNAHVQPLVGPNVTISLTAQNQTPLANNAHYHLYATVKLLGSALQGAAVNFTANFQSNGVVATPPYSLTNSRINTNSTGVATTSIFGSVVSNVTATASFATYSANVVLRFQPAVQVTFVPSSSTASNFSGCGSTIAIIDGTGYNIGQLQSKVFSWAQGSQHTYTFTQTYCQSSTTRGIFGNATVYGVIEQPLSFSFVAPSNTTIPFAYRTQYYFTALSNPPAGGSVPSGGW